MKIYLVVDCADSPGRLYAVFAENDAAEDFLNHYHYGNAQIEERTLLYGQQVSAVGYIE